jgi:hypothetical protein
MMRGVPLRQTLSKEANVCWSKQFIVFVLTLVASLVAVLVSDSFIETV